MPKSNNNKFLSGTSAPVFVINCGCGYSSLCRSKKTHAIKKRLHYRMCDVEKPTGLVVPVVISVSNGRRTHTTA